MIENNKLYMQDIEPEDEGKYHTKTVYDEDDEPIGFRYILDENGNKIPLEICICYAREPSECGCNCNSWGDYHYDDDDDGWYEEEMKWIEHREMSYGGNYYDYF